MKVHKSYIVLGLVIAFTLFYGIIAHAHEVNQQIRVTFNEFVYRVSALLDDLVVRRGTKRVSIRFTASMENASAS
jgi:hypothetical protein